jgi:hypothetical protein
VRNLLIGVLMGLLVAGPIAYTQQPPESIEVGGVLLQIGTPKDSVISKLAQKGLMITPVKDSDSVAVQAKNEHGDYDVVGMLSFTNSRLRWASRSWDYSSDPGAAKLARSFYFLLKSFEENGNTSCTISTKTQEATELDHKSIEILCGKRVATLFVTTYKNQRPSATLDENIR